MRPALLRLLTVPSVLVAMLVALAASASAGPTDVVRWDTSTCATDGAASPVIVLENTASQGFGLVWWLDGESYTSIIAPPLSADEYTLPPVVAGARYLQVTRGEQPAAQDARTDITAPACPAGSPPPSANAYPKQSGDPGTAVLAADLGDPECQARGDGTTRPVVPFTWSNTGDADGVMRGFVDDELSTETIIRPGSSGTARVEPMRDGEHTYEIRTDDGVVLDSITTAPPACQESTGTPTTVPITSPSSDPPPSATVGGGPQTPAVVQTDGGSVLPSMALLVWALLAVTVTGGTLTALVPVRVRGRTRRH